MEKDSKGEREREEVTCITGVGTVCKLPCKLKSRKMHNTSCKANVNVNKAKLLEEAIEKNK